MKLTLVERMFILPNYMPCLGLVNVPKLEIMGVIQKNDS